MNTIFSTGPGFFAAVTDKTEPSVPPWHIRVLIARIEAYEAPVAACEPFDSTQFTLLPALAKGRPEVARALVALHAALAANLPLLREEAAR